MNGIYMCSSMYCLRYVIFLYEIMRLDMRLKYKVDSGKVVWIKFL